MKRSRLSPIVLAVVVLMLVSLACGTVTTVTQLPPASAPPVQVQNPTPVPPTTAPPTEPPTAAPTPTEASQKFFTEEFDNGSDNWKPFVTSGELSQLDLST